jgi:hypothetical protein
MPSTSAALEAHLKGAGQLFQAYGPEACSAGTLHTLFAGFRPLLVCFLTSKMFSYRLTGG